MGCSWSRANHRRRFHVSAHFQNSIKNIKNEENEEKKKKRKENGPVLMEIRRRATLPDVRRSFWQRCINASKAKQRPIN